MNDWKDRYPYLLDGPLSEAIKLATKNGDAVRAKQLWDILVSYRKSESPDVLKEAVLGDAK